MQYSHLDWMMVQRTTMKIRKSFEARLRKFEYDWVLEDTKYLFIFSHNDIMAV